MSAPIGNQFWKQRTKHGRDKIFSSPEALWEAAIEYFEYTDSRKWNVVDYKGKDIERVEIPTDTPYTLHGLCIFLDVNTAYFRQFKDDSKDFSTVITRIEEIIYTQKFEGAAVGAYNANIISRDLGLADKRETEIKGGITWTETKTYDKSE